MPVSAVSTVTCPTCKQSINIYDTPEYDAPEAELMTIMCPSCKEPLTFNLKTMRVRLRVGNNEIRLMNKMKCPRCGKGFILCESRPDAIVSGKCDHCGCCYRGNFKYLKTWESKPQSNTS